MTIAKTTFSGIVRDNRMMMQFILRTVYLNVEDISQVVTDELHKREIVLCDDKT